MSVKFPDGLDQEDMDLLINEWQVAGFEVDVYMGDQWVLSEDKIWHHEYDAVPKTVIVWGKEGLYKVRKAQYGRSGGKWKKDAIP